MTEVIVMVEDGVGGDISDDGVVKMTEVKALDIVDNGWNNSNITDSGNLLAVLMLTFGLRKIALAIQISWRCPAEKFSPPSCTWYRW